MQVLSTVTEKGRLSTQELLLALEEAVSKGETDFQIHASGQHDIGGPLWNKDGRTISIIVTNPGQRVGAMALPHTEILVEGSAPADCGWLNAGAIITVRGDCGDTCGHCAAQGKIYVQGRCGTRTGSLMKKDPLYEAPELWVLETVGSFSFEFMGGGIAVVCGLGCDGCALGERPCVGMVGGVVYVRGVLPKLSEGVERLPLTSEDVAFLAQGLPLFLEHVQRKNAFAELSHWEMWQKIVPLPETASQPKERPSLQNYRKNEWIPNGLFSDVFCDCFEHSRLVECGPWRLRVPLWNNEHVLQPCEHACPCGIATKDCYDMLHDEKNEQTLTRVLETTPFPATVCGTICHGMCQKACPHASNAPLQTKDLSPLASFHPKPPKIQHKEQILVVGAGVAGLSCAWRLLRLGYQVTIYEATETPGGCLQENLIDPNRQALFKEEVRRITSMGATIYTKHTVVQQELKGLCEQFSCVVLAIGMTHVQAPFCTLSSTVLCAATLSANEVRKFSNKKLLLLGASHQANRIAKLLSGSASLECLHSKAPTLDPSQIEEMLHLGVTIHYPCIVKSCSQEGVSTEDGRFFAADMVLDCTDPLPDPNFYPSKMLCDEQTELAPRLYGAGNAVLLGLFADAIASGNRCANIIHARLSKERAEQKPLAPLQIGTNTEHTASSKEHSLPCFNCARCRDCHACERNCPEQAITRIEVEERFIYSADPNRCIGCGICGAVCPCGIWKLIDNTEARFEVVLKKTAPSS